MSANAPHDDQAGAARQAAAHDHKLLIEALRHAAGHLQPLGRHLRTECDASAARGGSDKASVLHALNVLEQAGHHEAVRLKHLRLSAPATAHARALAVDALSLYGHSAAEAHAALRAGDTPAARLATKQVKQHVKHAEQLQGQVSHLLHITWHV